MGRDPNRKRGRPQKFGREAQLISVTLPRDVINWLGSLDDDLGWAIVKMYERSTKTRAKDSNVAQLVRFPGNRALIQVRADLFKDMPGVSLIPLNDGRGFLALEAGKGVADLELIVLDRMDDQRIEPSERDALIELRSLLKQWRQEGLRFESRSIIIAHGAGMRKGES
jgi:hypothetical protein